MAESRVDPGLSLRRSYTPEYCLNVHSIAPRSTDSSPSTPTFSVLYVLIRILTNSSDPRAALRGACICRIGFGRRVRPQSVGAYFGFDRDDLIMITASVNKRPWGRVEVGKQGKGM
jgi:hypothetical protein